MSKKILAIVSLFFVGLVIQIVAIIKLPDIHEDIFTILFGFSGVPVALAMHIIKGLLTVKYSIIKFLLNIFIFMAITYFVVFSLATIFTDINFCQSFYEMYSA